MKKVHTVAKFVLPLLWIITTSVLCNGFTDYTFRISAVFIVLYLFGYGKAIMDIYDH